MIALTGMSTVNAQTANDIISKSTDAVGGKEVLSKIKSVYIEAVASVMGLDLPTKIIVLTGKGFRNETNYNGMDIIQCFTDTSGWMINPVQGQATAVALPIEAVKLGKPSLDIRGELYGFQEKGYTDSLLGREDYQGVSAYKIKLSKAGMDIVYLIDPNTYYILRMDISVSVEGKNITTATTYSNYKKTDFGYVMAFTSGVNNSGYDVTMNYTKVEINKETDPKVFAMPK